MSWGAEEDVVEVVAHATIENTAAAGRSTRQTRLRLLENSLRCFMGCFFPDLRGSAILLLT
jgi:hypothetical protein